MKIEYRVKEVKRYIVTRYERSEHCGTSTTRGEFDNFDTAYNVGYAMAKLEHEQLGYPVGDSRIKYPNPEKPASDILADIPSQLVREH